MFVDLCGGVRDKETKMSWGKKIIPNAQKDILFTILHIQTAVVKIINNNARGIAL